MAGLLTAARVAGKVAGKVASAVKIPTGTVADVDLKGVTFDHIEYLAKVCIDNPYPVPIPIMDINYNLKTDDRVVAHGTIADPGNIEANGTTDLDVTVKVPHMALVRIVIDIAKDWDVDYELELGLVIDLPVGGRFIIPLSNKGEVKIPTLLGVFFFLKKCREIVHILSCGSI